MILNTDKMVNGDKLLETLFHESDRPSCRTLQYWRERRIIPYYKIGGLIYYDVTQVRESLEKKNKIRAL